MQKGGSIIKLKQDNSGDLTEEMEPEIQELTGGFIYLFVVKVIAVLSTTACILNSVQLLTMIFPPRLLLFGGLVSSSEVTHEKRSL